jgi:hypothetical protein
LAKIEEDRKREEERIRKEEEAKRNAFIRAVQPTEAKAPVVKVAAAPVTPAAVKPAESAALSKGGVGAFDAGLLIAFPVIVATLMLFFLFPFLGPEFAKNLPPVPLD